MIILDVFEGSGGIARFAVRGHAGFGKPGQDIVCAAVSALVYNAINSAERLLGARLDASDRRDELTCSVRPEADRPEVQLLLRSMVLGVEQIADLYPRHVQIRKHASAGPE
ncbi:MAG: ribosomal-processing cysteine protease Prp [Alicyclobacillaceae bacterium]|nr:ribosomal-processing cysteine protease Prp [Alicyclobacillaceae bacterium]